MNDGNKKGKKAVIMICTAAAVFLCAFGFLAWAIIMDERGVSDAVLLPIGFGGFLGCCILSLVLIFNALPSLAILDMLKIEKQYQGKELIELVLIDKVTMGINLLEKRFKYTEEGYYKKKKFSFIKDCITYYVRMVEDMNIESAVLRETLNFDRIKKKGKNPCLLLFVYLNKVDEEEKKFIKKLGTDAIVAESITSSLLGESTVVIAVDRSTYKGYFLDIGRNSVVTIYSYGCKMLKRLYG